MREVTLEEVRKMLQAANRKAQEVKKPSTIAIVDFGGHLRGQRAAGHGDFLGIHDFALRTAPVRLVAALLDAQGLAALGDDRAGENHPNAALLREEADAVLLGAVGGVTLVWLLGKYHLGRCQSRSDININPPLTPTYSAPVGPIAGPGKKLLNRGPVPTCCSHTIAPVRKSTAVQ